MYTIQSLFVLMSVKFSGGFHLLIGLASNRKLLPLSEHSTLKSNKFQGPVPYMTMAVGEDINSIFVKFNYSDI